MDAFDFKSNPEMVFIRYVTLEPDADGLLHLRDRWGPYMVNHFPAFEALEILTHDLLIEWTWWIPEVYTTPRLVNVSMPPIAHHTMIDVISTLEGTNQPDLRMSLKRIRWKQCAIMDTLCLWPVSVRGSYGCLQLRHELSWISNTCTVIQ